MYPIGNGLALGYEQVKGLGVVGRLNPPPGATSALIAVSGAAIRWLDDGADPTTSVGFTLAQDSKFMYGGNPQNVRLIGASGAAVVDVLYYGPRNLGPAPYRANAVHFDGSTDISIATLAAGTDNGKFTYAALVRQGAAVNPVIFAVDAAGSGAVYLRYETATQNVPLQFAFQKDDLTAGVKSAAIGNVQGDWALLVGSADASVFPYLARAYLGNSDTGAFASVGAAPFVPTIDGVPFSIGTDGTDHFEGDMANFRVWAGTSILDSSGLLLPSSLGLFVDANGNPVDPAVAETVLGAPTISFSGVAADWVAQAAAQGFTITGTLTDAGPVIL